MIVYYLLIYLFVSHLCSTVQAGGSIYKCFLEAKMTPAAQFAYYNNLRKIITEILAYI